MRVCPSIYSSKKFALNSPLFLRPFVLRCSPVLACAPPTTTDVFHRQFMQRKARVDEAQKQQQARRDKLERDFSSLYAKRLKADTDNEKDR